MANKIPAVVEWDSERWVLRLLDQTRLPAEEFYLDIDSVAALEDAILRLAVRGAPAIGCAGAFGVVFCAVEAQSTELLLEFPNAEERAAWLPRFNKACEHLANTRPTAVNLRWAVERCRKRALTCFEENRAFDNEGGILFSILDSAKSILEEDKQMCAAIGHHGAGLLEGILNGKKSAILMTHCNAGALATGGSGTALSVMYEAQKRGIALKVFADETRPLLQGGRLTAWELTRAGIETTVICDNMAASVMRQFKPDAVIVGADRIAANGDAANKIGTYGLAILAKHHGVPFFVAAPSSTYDLALKSGAEIPIEERKREEIAEPYGKLSVPPEAKVFNPAFDVTPAELISAHITERGVFKAPYDFK